MAFPSLILRKNCLRAVDRGYKFTCVLVRLAERVDRIIPLLMPTNLTIYQTSFVRPSRPFVATASMTTFASFSTRFEYFILLTIFSIS